MPKLQAVELNKSYRGRKVVDNVDLEIAEGEVVGLLGPNGAGKTTTFYILVGLARPDSGRVLLDGEDITDLPMYMRARNGISYLPQEPSVFRQLTVEENLLAVLETLPLTATQQRDRLEELLAQMGRGMVQDVSDQMFRKFTEAMRRQLEEGEPPRAAGEETVAARTVAAAPATSAAQVAAGAFRFQALVQDVVDQRGLAGTGNAGDGYHRAERDHQVDVLQVVRARAKNSQKSSIRFMTQRGHGNSQFARQVARRKRFAALQ